MSRYVTTKMEHVRFFNLLRRAKNETHVVCTIPTCNLIPPTLIQKRSGELEISTIISSRDKQTNKKGTSWMTPSCYLGVILALVIYILLILVCTYVCV